MFKKTTPELDHLALAIRDVHLDMKNQKTDSAEYKVLLDRLVVLYSLKETPKSGVSADVKATIAANLAGIFLLMNHERAHVVTTKALSFVQKLR